MKNVPSFLNTAWPAADEIDWQDAYTRCLPRVFHFFCYKVGDSTLAEDLTATTFEKAWRNRRTFRGDATRVAPWLMGIARRTAADHFRKGTRDVPLQEADHPQWQVPEAEALQRKLDFEFILTVLARFPEREQELVALKYGAELTNREIARLTGLSESNVGTILHRVVEKLRYEWEKSNG